MSTGSAGPAVATGAQVSADRLPATGSNTGPVTLLALASMLLGGLLLLLSGRRTERRRAVASSERP